MATSSPHIASLLSSSSSFISNSYLSLRTRSLPSLTPISHSPIHNKKFIVFRDHSILLSRKSKTLDPILAAAEDVAVSSSDASAVDATQQLVVSNTDDGVSSTIIQVLLVVAFLGLSILTVGVIYLGVTDFLQKREKDKFEKEEAAKKSGKKKRKKVVRAGPRGFGQKIVEDDDNDDD